MTILAKLFGWSLKNPLIYLVMFLTIGGAVVVMGKNSDISYLKKQLVIAEGARDDFNRRLGICQGNATRLLDAADRQNKAIADMAAAAHSREQQFDLVLDGIKKDRLATDKTVRDLLTRPAPADKCAGASALVREHSR